MSKMSEARAYMPKVTVVPATLNRFTAAPIHSTRKRRVAAYARVSTNDEEQANSYEAQVSHYTRHIQENPEWEFVSVYADKGITGTSTKKREQFNDMVQDALAGKIDLIITKSVSRFARNTVDTLTTIRLLKEHGVEVYFEEQNIYSLDSKGELLLTIMSSLAQEESRNISENVTWGMRKRFADGKVALPYKQFLGYKKGADGIPEIVPEEAATIKLIYRLFMEGKSPAYIARFLSTCNIPSPAGRPQWRPETVKSILSNEKYKGDAILQKTFCTDFLTKKMKVNEGEVPQYYVENSHPAIISPEMFEAVQAELAKRKKPGHRNYTPHCFSGRIFCDECGALYGSKVWNSGTKYKAMVWQCNNKHLNHTRCSTPSLRNETIEDGFVMAINRLLKNKDEIIQVCEKVMSKRCDTSGLEEEKAKLQAELEVTCGLMERLIAMNAAKAMNQDEYNRQFAEYEARYNEIRQRIADVESEQKQRIAKRGKLAKYLETLRNQGLISSFNETLWYGTVEQVRVTTEGNLHFIFRDGQEITV